MPDAFDALLPAETDGPDATRALGARLAGALAPGDVVALEGDLGAGKTHLAKGLVAGLGGDPEAVTSPTFTLVQHYDARVPVRHLDLYRLDGDAALDGIGFDELLEPDAVVLVEWPERAAGRFPAETRRLRLRHLGGDRRRLELCSDEPQ